MLQTIFNAAPGSEGSTGGMSVPQFVASLRRIRLARHVNRPAAVARHVGWQLRRLLGGFPVTLRISNSWISDDSSAGVIALVNALGLYDFNNMTLFADCLRDGGTFFDIGANIGSYTVLLSENENIEVIGFEPNPSAFAKLEANVALNRRSNVTLVNAALSCRDGEVLMTNDGSSAENRVVTSAAEQGISVRSRRLQPFLEEGSTPRPMAAKIDVEGHEADVIAGAGDALRSIQLVALEQLPGADSSSLMHSRGFEGPYYADAKAKRLSRERLVQPPFSEDGIFLSDGGRLAAAHGWRLG